MGPYILALLAATAAQAQTQPPSQPPVRIEEHVDVRERPRDAPTAPSVRQADPARLLDAAGGLDDLLQSLTLLPGVASTNDKEDRTSVRGGGPEHNVVVFDGVQVHSPQRAGDFAVSFVNPSVVAAVSVDASGLDARYGGRLSSVTTIETRSGRTDRRLAGSGSVGLTSGDLLLEGRLPSTASGSWWVAGRGTYYKLVADRLRDEGVPGFGDVQFKVDVKPTAHTDLSMVGLVGHEGLTETNAGSTADGEREVRQRLANGHRLGSITLRWQPGSRLMASTAATFYSSASSYDDRREIDGSDPFHRDIGITDLAIRQRATFAWSPRQLLDFGAEVRHLKTTWSMAGRTVAPLVRPLGPDTWGGLIEYRGPIHSQIGKTLTSLWLQDRVLFPADFAVEPGVRVDWNSLTGEAAPQPRLRVTKAVGRTVVWAGFASQAQTPGHETMQQGYAYFDLTGPERSALENERSRQVVAGVQRDFAAGLTVRVEAYRRAFSRLLVQRLETDAERAARLEDYIVPADAPPGSAILEYRPTVHPDSIGTGRAAGIELLVQRTRGRVTGWASYTLSKSERELYGRTVPFDFERRHAIAVAWSVQLTSRIRASATSQYATGFPLTPLHPEMYFTEEHQIHPVPVPPFAPIRQIDGSLLLLTTLDAPLRLSLLNSARLPAYARTDARVALTLTRWLDVYGEVLNLFARDNFHPRAEVYEGLVLPYEVAPSLPRLPTYGIRVRF